MAKMLKYVNGDLVEYEVLNLVDFYDKILRKPTQKFDFNSPNAKKDADYLAYSLVETMSKHGGLGLSANQCGISKRVFVMNMGDQAWLFFNPEIIYKSEELADFSEGCLSYPGLYLKLKRSKSIKVRFQDMRGQFVEKEFDGLTAVCIQHEIDHLDGIVYTDLVSPINLEKAKRKIKQNIKKAHNISPEQLEALAKKAGLDKRT